MSTDNEWIVIFHNAYKKIEFKNMFQEIWGAMYALKDGRKS